MRPAKPNATRTVAFIPVLLSDLQLSDTDCIQKGAMMKVSKKELDSCESGHQSTS